MGYEIVNTSGTTTLCNLTKCEICGGDVLTPITEAPKHICDDCASKLRKLLGKENG